MSLAGFGGSATAAWKRLEAAYEAAVRGQPRLALLTGGRSADLCRDFVAHAKSDGAHVLAIRCEPADGDVPFAPLDRLARALTVDAATGPGSVLATPTTAGYLAYLARFETDFADLVGMPPRDLRRGAFLAVADLLAERATDDYVVAYLGALHRADPGTIEWFSALVHRLASHDGPLRLLVVCQAAEPRLSLPARPGGGLEVLTLDVPSFRKPEESGDVASEAIAGASAAEPSPADLVAAGRRWSRACIPDRARACLQAALLQADAAPGGVLPGVDIAALLQALAEAEFQLGNLADCEALLASREAFGQEDSTALQLRGAVAHVRGDRRGAADSYRSACAAAPAGSADAALALLGEAEARQGLGEHREAISAARRALVASESLGRVFDEARAHGLIGNCYQRLGEWELAQMEHETALALRERIGDAGGVAISLNNLAILSGSLGRWQGAMQYYSRCLALSRHLGDFRSVAIVLGNLGELLLARGDDREAERQLLEALEIVQHLDDQAAEIIIVGNLGAVYLSRGAPALALEALDRCLGLIAQTGLTYYSADVHYFRGRAYQVLGNISAATAEHNEARRIAVELGHLAFLGVIDRALAELAEGSGRKDQALELALRSERALRPAGMPLEHARTLALLARLAAPGQREEWRQAAEAFFDRLGAQRDLERLREAVPDSERSTGAPRASGGEPVRRTGPISL
jgi:tetratricopeptide (TPR) repeat protein